jgi:hypothetical protein
MTISFHSSARCSEPAVVAKSLLGLVQRVQTEHALLLDPLRLILVTANLGEAVNFWNRELGLPESGVSNQAEGSVVGKHMFWGTDMNPHGRLFFLRTAWPLAWRLIFR